jgi:hypothetical protein
MFRSTFFGSSSSGENNAPPDHSRDDDEHGHPAPSGSIDLGPLDASLSLPAGCHSFPAPSLAGRHSFPAPSVSVDSASLAVGSSLLAADNSSPEPSGSRDFGPLGDRGLQLKPPVPANGVEFDLPPSDEIPLQPDGVFLDLSGSELLRLNFEAQFSSGLISENETLKRRIAELEKSIADLEDRDLRSQQTIADMKDRDLGSQQIIQAQHRDIERLLALNGQLDNINEVVLGVVKDATVLLAAHSQDPEPRNTNHFNDSAQPSGAGFFSPSWLQNPPPSVSPEQWRSVWVSGVAASLGAPAAAQSNAAQAVSTDLVDGQARTAASMLHQ